MKNQTILEIKAKELRTYIDHGYDQDLANIANWEAKSLIEARNKRNDECRKVELTAVEQISTLRTKYPEGVADEKYANQKAIVDETTRAQKSLIDDRYIAEKIKIREDAYNKRGEADTKLRNAKSELEQLQSQIAFGSAGSSKKNRLM